MLVTIENLPSYFEYSTIKALINEHCKLPNVILGDLVTQGNTKKITVGVPCKEDVIILARNMSQIEIEGQRLIVTELTKTKNSIITQNINDQACCVPSKTFQTENIHATQRKGGPNLKTQYFNNNLSRKRPFDYLSPNNIFDNNIEITPQTENIAVPSTFRNNEQNIFKGCDQNIQKQINEWDIETRSQLNDLNGPSASRSQVHVGIDIAFPMTTKENQSLPNENANKINTKRLKRQRKRHARTLRAILASESETTPVQSSLNPHSNYEQNSPLVDSPVHLKDVKNLAVSISRSTGPLSLEQSNQVSEALMKKIVSLSKMENVVVKPKFRSVAFFIDGSLKLWCADHETLDWLKTSITELNTEMNLNLMLTPQVFAAFKDYCHFDLPGLWPALATIRNIMILQNDWLKLHDWHFIDVNVDNIKNVSTVCVRITREQIQDLKNRSCRLNFGLGTVPVKFLNKKSKSANILKAKHAAHAQKGVMVLKKPVDIINLVKEETPSIAIVKKEEDLSTIALPNEEKRKRSLSIVVNPYSVIDKVIAAANSSLSDLRVKRETDNLHKTIKLEI